jgi:hypothetical protein
MRSDVQSGGGRVEVHDETVGLGTAIDRRPRHPDYGPWRLDRNWDGGSLSSRNAPS